ncbi:NAD(P)H-dependent oxidoreductase [Mucilaginibacter terrae]|uniref:Nitroreductase/dihydropteridine reductase n=1 Tax=Mucilaginibacter terrae TaxID=1955052 RepID=A0ABU3GUG3_9SPHI|nr:NAD(P)H-dependent oxidoreductase [Mucilaginibacter terrae]MDT3403414.1 nitroreductase/dihydropteridine reductase [Mucilaginibacter terrae]
MSVKQALAWRYATKKFDKAKKISSDDLNHILESTHLSPSSYGLQHYKIVVVEDPAIRERLKEAAYGQSQITDASHLVVFAAETNIDEEYVKRYVDQLAHERGVDRSSLEGFEKVMMGKISTLSPEQNLAWAQKQAYLALGILIGAASELSVDNCPMEGFEAEKFDEILGLKEKNVTATVIVTIGYRADDDPYAKLAKVRKPASELFIKI